MSQSSRGSDASAYLFGLELFGMKLGLENIERLVEALGHPERAYRTVHVAGTNGKGSVTAMIDAALNAAGYRSARYTSPHLVDLTERFVVGGTPVAAATLDDTVTHVRTTIDALLARGSLRAHPTFFEVTTAVGFEIFRRSNADIAVCEVGLGGRLDATNVVQPEVCAITTIGLDHLDQLGGTLELVASEKAGIIKPGVPIVVGPMEEAAAEVVRSTARDRAAPCIEAYRDVTMRQSRGPGHVPQAVTLRTPRHDYGTVEINLAGAHQVDNAVTAVRVLEALDERGTPVPPHAIASGLRQVHWPGRLDRRLTRSGADVLFDAAHNPQGAAALAAYLVDEPGGARTLIFGAMRDKDAAGVLAPLLAVVDAAIMTRAPGARAADPQSLADLARQLAPDLTVLVADPIEAAWTLALTRSARVVVTGSIFLVGEVLKRYQGSW